jgi:hypothetical protein
MNVGFEVLTTLVRKCTSMIAGDKHLLATCIDAGKLLGLFFDLEDRGDMFLRNVG